MIVIIYATTHGDAMPPFATDAIEAARAYIADRWQGIPGYAGAFLAGSIATLAADEPLAPGSDVDVMIVLEASAALPDRKPGKIRAGGVVLDVTLLPASDIDDPEGAHASYHLAHGLAHARVIDDPSGRIERARARVQAEFADPAHVRQRLDAVQAIAETRLSGEFADHSLPGAVMQWQFGVGLVPHLVLVAAGRNPTVRRRYAACRDVLAEAGEGRAYERLLALAGYDRVDLDTIQALMPPLERAFDAISPHAAASALPHPSDIEPQARDIAIGGVTAMIASGDVREAMFWLLATWCRLMLALESVPGRILDEDRIRADFLAAIGAVGVHGLPSVAARAREARAALPAYRRLADTMSVAPPV